MNWIDWLINRGEKEHRPKPRYTIPGTPTSQGTLSEMSFNDTMSIRQAVYEEWRKEKLKSARKEKKEQELKKQEEEKKKEEVRDILDKSTESILSSVAFSEVKLLSIYLCTLQPTLNNIGRKHGLVIFTNNTITAIDLKSCIIC